MRVNIGPYTSWIGPYQLVDMLFFWHEKYPSDELANRWDYRLHDQFSDWLADTWVKDFCEWIHSKKQRRVKIRIDRYDVWSMDHTLALIIVPMLKQLQAVKHGFAMIPDEDVPEHLRSTNAPPRVNEWDVDDLAEARYEWLLNELIWTFEQISNDDSTDQFYDHSAVDHKANINDQIGQIKVDRAGLEEHERRINNGLMLFGKYYRSLWD